ncbi:MAG: HindIII family type II restriction endonuclease [Nitrososphaeria archaeon]
MFKYPDVIELISELCKKEEDLEKRTKILQERIGYWNEKKLIYHLSHVGVIPETFEHDSSEEKFYAKYCDVLIYGFFKLYGMDAELVTTRGDQPDVIGRLRNKYVIIADAKAFRLSRTALNPKDYKISAVDRWKKQQNADYACLVSSFFPKGRSRLFQEAVTHGVALLSYAHLQYILLDPNWRSIDLESLWQIPLLLSRTKNVNVDSNKYWKIIRKWLNDNVNAKERLDRIEETYIKNIIEEGKRQIACLEEEKKKISTLSKEEMIKRLSREIDRKISQVREKINELSNMENLNMFF